LEQPNGVATGQLIATQTASELVVENRKLKNKIEALEHRRGSDGRVGDLETA
jgi:hypothetical protein